MKINWLDQAILWAAPRAGTRRIAARAMSENVIETVRGFEAASRGRRMKNWKPGSLGANTEARPNLGILRDRSRDLIRNEAYARGALDSVVTNVIGAGIIAHAVAKTIGRADKFDMLWMEWAESTDCDVDGRNNMYGLQALAFRTMFESGEVLVVRRKRGSMMNLAVPIQLQILEPDFIDTHKEGELPDGGFIVQGVEFDRMGQRRGYWLFDRHPGEAGAPFTRGHTSKFHSADDVKHLFRADRPGQVRGLPWMTPIMVRMKDYADYSDATLLRQKLAACFTAFVTNPEDISGGPVTVPPLGEKLEPGLIEILKPGQSVEFANPPSSGDFAQFTREQLRGIARGIGLSYEVLTGDYSQVNFSSGRMGWIEFNRNIDQWRWHIMIPHFCVPVWRWFTEAAALVGYGADKVGARWTPPRREMIDPVAETDAAMKQVRAGFKSASAIIREMGEEPAEVRDEIAADNDAYDKLGLILDSDPRKTNEFGAPYNPNELKEDEPAQKPEASPAKEPEDEERYLQDAEGGLYKVSKHVVEKIN